MAKRTIVTTLYADDLTGEEVPEDSIRSIQFTMGGVVYEIDLGPKSVEKFDKAMAPWIAAARRVGGKKSTAARKGATPAAEVRAWAQSNGITVPERGRIPETVREQYEAANAA